MREIIRDKKGVSEVIATVLIILITIAGVAVIAGFVIPWVQNSLGDSGNCFKTINQLTILDEGSCYSISDDGTNDYTKINVKFGDIKITEMNLILEKGSQMISYRIKNGTAYTGADNTLKINDGNIIKLGTNGAKKSYTINNQVSKNVKIVPVINGKPCDSSVYEINLMQCEN